MASRSVSSPTQYLSDTDYRSGQYIRASEHSDIINDQIYIVERAEMVFSDCFYTLQFSDATHASGFTELCRYSLDGPDRCSATHSTKGSGYFYAYCWASTPSEDFDIRINDGSVQGTIASTAGVTTPTWLGPAAFAGILESPTINNYTIEIRHVAGSGTIYIGGVALYTD